MNFNVKFNDGVEVTIGKKENFDANMTIFVDNINAYLNVYGGSENDIEFNNALSIGNSSVVFNTIDDRLDGILSL